MTGEVRGGMRPYGARIPAELRERDQWVVWRHETGVDGKPKKPPYRVDGKGKASSNGQVHL